MPWTSGPPRRGQRPLSRRSPCSHRAWLRPLSAALRTRVTAAKHPGRGGDPAHLGSSSPPKPLGIPGAIGTHPTERTPVRLGSIAASPDFRDRKLNEMGRQRNLFQMKEEKPNETGNLPDKYLQTLLTKLLTDLGERTDKHKNFNKELENIKAEVVRTEEYNKQEIRSKGTGSRRDDREGCTDDLEDKVMETVESEQEEET